MTEIFDNIRKIYTFASACPELANYIEFFSESSPELTKKFIGHSNFTVKMFASWTPTFYINLGDPYLLISGNNINKINAGEDVVILRNNMVERVNNPSDHIFTVKFHPGGLEAVLGISQLNYISKITDLRTLLPGNLLQQLKQRVTFEERCVLFQDYLLTLLKKQKYNDHYLHFVRDCIGNYNPGSSALNTGKMAEKMFVSSKTINRYFNRVVGLSPKSYFSLLRARTALNQFVNDRKDFLPYDFGYYDMSHFYRDAEKFTGQKVTGAIL